MLANKYITRRGENGCTRVRDYVERLLVRYEYKFIPGPRDPEVPGARPVFLDIPYG